MTIEEIPLPVRCPDCGAWLPPAAMQCPHCGRPRGPERAGPPDGVGHRSWLMSWGRAAALVAFGVLFGWAIGPPGEWGPSASPSPSVQAARVSAAPAPQIPVAVQADQPVERLIPGVRPWLTVDGVSFSLGVPATGWVRHGGLYMSKSRHGPQQAEAMIFWAGYPRGRYVQPCDYLAPERVAATGLDVATMVSTVPGMEVVTPPSDTTLGGQPARRVDVMVRNDGWSCGPGFLFTWEGDEASGGPLWGRTGIGDTIQLWFVEVEGAAFVVGAQFHGEGGIGLEQQVEQIIDSIRFESSPEFSPRRADFAIGRHEVGVDGTPLSFYVPASNWEPGPRPELEYRVSITKSTSGPQDAELMIYWTRFPEGGYAVPCPYIASQPASSSVADLATAVATAPGTELVSGPIDVTLGGFPSREIVVLVRESLGCGPGYFYTWEVTKGGAFWLTTEPGDTIRVWIVDVDGAIVFIAGETRPGAGDEQIRQIVESMQFGQVSG
jgi:hypothetical protein